MNKNQLKKELKLSAKEELLLELFNEEMERLYRDFKNNEMILLDTKLGIQYIKIILLGNTSKSNWSSTPFSLLCYVHLYIYRFIPF